MIEDKKDITQTLIGKNLEDCKKKLFDMYGYDYVIINKRQVFTGGLLGFFQKEALEVVYTIKNRNEDITGFTGRSASLNNRYQVSDTNADIFEKNRAAILKSTADPVLITKQVASLDSRIDAKLDAMRNDIQNQLRTITVSQPGKHQTIQKIEDLLAENEFTFKYITMLTDRIKTEFSLEELDDFSKIQRKVVDWIGHSISVVSVKMFRPPHVVVIVGPTGVGKTTTIAKLAANQVLEAKNYHKPLPELCIVTIDSMRVGAVEQISRFGALLNTDVKKAETAEDVRKIYEDTKESVDAIYIIHVQVQVKVILNYRASVARNMINMALVVYVLTALKKD